MLFQRWAVSGTLVLSSLSVLIGCVCRRVIYTAGTDSMVRIHSVGEIDTGEPEFLDDHPEAVTCCVSTVSLYRGDLVADAR